MKNHTCILIFTASAVAIPPVALAQNRLPFCPPIFCGGTIYEMPLPMDSECDQYNGVLYNLCVEYCTDRNCPEENVDNSDTFCSTVKTAFEALTGGTLPCDVRCPCWEASELDIFATVDQRSEFSCNNYNVEGEAIIQSVFPPSEAQAPNEGGFGVVISPVHECFTRGDFEQGLIIEITQQEADVCYNEIVAKCAELGTPI